jgi:isoleucyl-tRNA synthetase
MGIDKYNAECRAIVMRYAGEWRSTVERMGRWIDFDRDYKTLNTSFMESVWWAFSELFKKGLVYRGLRVLPYSTGCTTPLSNFEAGLDYREVNDPAGELYELLPVCSPSHEMQSPLRFPSSTTALLPSSRGRPRHGPFPPI